eukprot:TRINITY_DN69468_c0_g1_i1.p1 TRINITY_DN69468_c0_g1~~TRINITY_DN69468_c0_g1_i1.p1  ORF type:complete len:673 (-),score=135.61 TRINITY_DN69468_c0_g1_i1:81-2024(-)
MAAAETVGVVVASSRIGSVIGKAGAGLRQAREQSNGCKLDVVQGDMSTPTRRVNLLGDIHQVCAAFGIVALAAYRDPNDGVPTLMVREEKVGTIVGKGGSNLQYVREKFDVQVKVDRDVLVDAATGVRERVVTLIGEPARLGAALFAAFGGDAWRGTSVAPRQLGALATSQALAARMGIVGAPGMPAGALSHVSPPSDDPEHVQLQMYIDDKLVGAIVGKEGSTIKQTSAAAGCSVCVTNRDMGPRRVVINGGFSQAMSAQSMVFEQMRSAMAAADGTGIESLTEVKVIYLVRKEAAGAVIGKQGSQLANIREQSQVKIQLDKEEMQGHRPCTLSGSLQSVMTAEKCIFDTIAQMDMNQSGGQKHFMDSPSSEMPPAKRNRSDGGYEAIAHTGYEDGTSVDTPTRILVPTRSAGAVIGKQGANLKSLRESFQVKVKLLHAEEAPQWPGDRVVELTGSSSSKQGAVQQICATAFATELEAVVLKVLVPSNLAGAVIGKQGANLRSIREQTGIASHLERTPVLGERVFTATGSLDQVSNVASILLGLLDSQGQASDTETQANGAGAPHGGQMGVDLTQYYANGAAQVRASTGYGTFGSTGFGMGQSQATTMDNSGGCGGGGQYGGGGAAPFTSSGGQFGGTNQATGPYL